MIQVVCLGKMKASPDYQGLSTLCQSYVKRVQPWCPVQLIELPESRRPDIQTAQADEAALLSPYVQKARQVLLWQEHGQQSNSPDWAHWLTQQRNLHGFSVANPWLWIIAGPSGPHASLVAASHVKRSLSPMTFPHLIARLLVLEQLYRGLAIAHGVPYHK
jgi:23S rRNA (pseudouridine1915-N3)-methyltransferase